MADNIPAIIAQAEALGFQGVTASKLIPGRWLRFRVDGHRQRDAGRIKLAEITLKNGRHVFIGVIGIFDGADFHYEKIDLSGDKDKYGSTTEERKKIAAQLKKQREITEAAERAKADKAAREAERYSFNCKPAVPSSALYLSDKFVNAYDIKQSGDGAAVVAIRVGGRIVALQFLLSNSIPSHVEKIRRIGTNKRIWPKDCKIKGGYHWIGGIPRPGDVIVIAEGYATAATVHKATGLICVVAFSAGNIKPVVDALLAKHPDARLLIAADDDDLKQCPVETCRHRFMLSRQDDREHCPECGAAHKRNNAGVLAAMQACTDGRVSYLMPRWADSGWRLHEWVKHGNKRTDFNDLMIDEGEAAVRLEFERYIADLRLRLPSHVQPVSGLPPADATQSKYMVDDLHDALARFVLIADGGDCVFDMKLRKVIKMRDAKNQICPRENRTRWDEAKEPDKQVIKLDDIDLYFDEKDRNKPGNQWPGLATQPVQDDDAWEVITTFIKNVLCSGDDTVYKHLMRCLALPLQQLGVKVHTAIIIRSREGVGKDTFGKLISSPYGLHAIMLDNNDLNDRFNPHMDGILQCRYQEIGDSSGKVRHLLLNLIKHWVTGEVLRINPKNINARMAKNRTNFLFFTNETLPFMLGRDGRRFLVLNPLKNTEKEYYKKITALFTSERGQNAYLYGMLNYPLEGFGGWEEAPGTDAKDEMIDLSKPPVNLFWDDFIAGLIPELPNNIPGRSTGSVTLVERCATTPG